MKTLHEWQVAFTRAANKKFPGNKKWSEQDRVLSILRQLGDVSKGVQWDQDKYKMTKEEEEHFKSTNHRIASLIADILILCEKREISNMELQKELDQVLKWYQGK